MFFVFLMLSRLVIAGLWSPAGKELTSLLLSVCLLYFCYFPMWYPGSGVALDCIVSSSYFVFLTLNNHIIYCEDLHCLIYLIILLHPFIVALT